MVMTFDVDALYGIELVVSQPARQRTVVTAIVIPACLYEVFKVVSPLLVIVRNVMSYRPHQIHLAKPWLAYRRGNVGFPAVIIEPQLTGLGRFLPDDPPGTGRSANYWQIN
jgi:hypothetical protein